MKKHEWLKLHLQKHIQQGKLLPGTRLPSIRSLSQQYTLSKNTVIRALSDLEELQLIHAQPRQGFIVNAHPSSSVVLKPRQVTLGTTAFSVLGAANEPGNLALGSAYPDARWPTVSWFYRQQSKQARLWANKSHRHISHYSTPPGDPLFRSALADHLNSTTFACDPHEIVITHGAQEAVSLCLRSVAQPGDTIAVESPCYYGTLQCIEALGLNVLELPSNPIGGTNLDALTQALQQWEIKALLTNPSYNNPLGFSLDLNNRKKLMDIANQWDIAIIEDDVFLELGFNTQRHTPLKALDKEQRVLYCGSLSKTMDADIRLGWVLPGRYYDQLNYYKFVTSISCSALLQQSAATLLKGRRYRTHLKTITQHYQQRCHLLAEDVERYWPDGVQFIRPKGGLLQWYELPPSIDSDLLFKEALDEGIGISPGNLFCADQRFGHHIRLCFSHYTRTEQQRSAIIKLGKMMNSLQSD
ncbi:PLP-dependent aminotransferase family protein [uncultured Neptuniibacter sp.]|uniref:aminotransferase-like domain-containing protein n=1 Tax=uncultured Neptuniibacter sp. TaxID=502143 RepID=UPI00261662B6|nr:PLP-dependent aminotransferase family protein [uncultured Neptuniibacter sp.]